MNAEIGYGDQNYLWYQALNVFISAIKVDILNTGLYNN